MFGGNRAKKILELCQGRDSTSKGPVRGKIDGVFWSSKRTSNWFCNRGLSPPPVNNAEPQNETASSSELSNQKVVMLEVKTPTKNAEPQDEIASSSELSDQKMVIREVKTPTKNAEPQDEIASSSELSDQKMVIREVKTPTKNAEPQDEIAISSESREQKIVIHEVIVFPPLNNKESPISLPFSPKYRVDNALSTPEDPFHTDHSSDEYFPSDHDCGSSSDSECKDDSRRKIKNKRAARFTKIASPVKSIIENQVLDVNNEYLVEENQLSPSSDIPETKNKFKNASPSNAMANFKNIHRSPIKSYKRKPDFCYYCETVVQNFARHIKRNHSSEVDVAEILSKDTKSKVRRILLDKLRRKGNFITSGVNLKAVRKPTLPDRTLLPCDNCLGYFSSKLLYRHRKKCNSGQKLGNAQAAGHNKLLNLKVNKRLREEVFPRMRIDKVSIIAKQDTLICAFGSRYLNVHREKHFIQVTSRKMRELAKILIELKKLEPSIEDLISALKPIHFDHFVTAAKIIGKYDADQDVYQSPTFAMNIATAIKQCCDIAITFLYKKQVPNLNVSSAQAEADLKTLILLFETNWKFEVSTHAANNLHHNKWNKVTVVPLASDLKLLREHLIQLAENAIKKISVNETLEAFNDLMESVYCRLILLNRKRSGELERMLLHTYVNNCSNKSGYEEFKKAISSSEQVLLNAFKRIVIRGKRGRGVPVLFSTDVQNHIQFLLKIRDQFVPKKNPYMFPRANSLSHIIGYKILNKHAKNCGAKNPTSITSTRLRKHLATLSQLFSLKETEIEQLATFMGHTTGVHKNSYRLPDDVYQTSKISKLLLIMEKGGADEYKGKTLDEIDIDMEENLLDIKQKSDESEEDYEGEAQPFENAIPSTSRIDAEKSVSTPKKPYKRTSKKPRVLVPWTEEQKNVVKLFFRDHIRASKPPKRAACEDLRAKHPDLLKNKDWLKIKVFIQNEYLKKKK